MTMHDRTRLLVGDEGLAQLRSRRVAVFGLGGVGGAAAEQLVRSAVGALMLVDTAKIDASNLNRQTLATRSTVGRAKVEVAAERFADIDPDCQLDLREAFFAADTADQFELTRFDYVLDCIDSLNPKVQLIRTCVELGVPVITSAGAGARTDPSGVRVSDLFSTHNCALAKALRKRLRKQGINEASATIPTVHSLVLPSQVERAERPPDDGADPDWRGRPREPVGSIAYVPPLFGCMMAGFVIRALLGEPLELNTSQ